MRRIWFFLLAALWLLPACASSQGVTLWTVSSFAGADAASALAYVEILQQYEAETGNTVVDNSATSDESWKSSVLSDFAAGNEPDVLFFFAASADSALILDRVVPISEINAAYPGLNLSEHPALTEADGRVYAIPVRPYWEGLFVNVDLFEQHGVELPTTWEKLETAIARFREEDIVPISVSLSDIPHYLAEFAILVSGPVEDYMKRPQRIEDVPPSFYTGMELIHRLYGLGAFAPNVSSTDEAAASQLFRDKKAAMQIDGSWFANTLPESSMDTTVVMPMPPYSADADPTAYIGGVSMGFYLTRRAWEDPQRRDAAVSLLAMLTREENRRRLAGGQLSGRLLSSVEALTDESHRMLSPLQDAMNKDARERWLLECIAPIADGSMTARECWEQVMALSPFEE